MFRSECCNWSFIRNYKHPVKRGYFYGRLVLLKGLRNKYNFNIYQRGIERVLACITFLLSCCGIMIKFGSLLLLLIVMNLNDFFLLWTFLWRWQYRRCIMSMVWCLMNMEPLLEWEFTGETEVLG
jgi:hypothetical protein